MGKNWAIVVGINNYDNLQPLKYAKRDAEAMMAWFGNEANFDQVFLFTEDSPAIKTNPPIPTQPTQGRFKRFLNAQFENPLLKPEDNLWFFFAGHGKRYIDQDYLMFLDSDPTDYTTAISVEFITQRLRRCGADNVVLLIDACRDEGDRSGLGVGIQEHKGVITFYSCTANQKSWEIDELQHGSFTYSLLEGLRIQGEANCATVERLDQHLRYRVPQTNVDYKKPIQNPAFKAEPPYKMYYILLEQYARIRDVEPLKYQASLAENEGDLNLAEQLWLRVLAVSRVDRDAIRAIGRIVLRQRGVREFTSSISEPVTLLTGDRAVISESEAATSIPIETTQQLQLTRTKEEHQYKLANFQQAFQRFSNKLLNNIVRVPELWILIFSARTDRTEVLRAILPAWYPKALTWFVYSISGVTVLSTLMIGIEWLKFSVKPLPILGSSVIIYARDGSTPLRASQIHVNMKRLEDFSPYLPSAIISSKDNGYYWHFGVDILRFLQGLLVNNSENAQSSYQTLTQQVARNLFSDYIGKQNSFGSKLREAIVALKLETFYSKDEILLIYLNQVKLGEDTYGFEDAAQYYFYKSAKELTLSEAATLVGILTAPNAFNFCGDGPNKLEPGEYRNRVIKRMVEIGKIKLEEANQARRSTIKISPQVCEQQAKTIAPYFYNYVFQELQSILGQEAAKEGNYIIETQLDPAIQSQAEAALRNSVNNAGSTFGFSQGAVITLDSTTGSILAMVGGTDYKKSKLNRAVQAKRQPGTTFKIFTYTAAIQQEIPASKTYSCAPLTWQGFTYKPCRAGADASFDIATGLALSENPIALRVAREIGLDKVVSMAQRLGIKSSLDPVPGLVLGESVVNVLEMTGAFGAIGNRGVWNQPHAISRVLDSSDCKDRNDINTCRVIYSFDQDPDANKRVLSNEVADEMTSLMRGVITRGTGRTAAIGLGEAGKTGTTNNNVDLWFIGFIPSRRLVTGVWLGNDNNSPTSGSSAQPAQLWGNYMRRITR